MPTQVTVRGEGITVDLLLWRAYGVRGRGLVEKTYEMNPGLAILGPTLPLDTQLVLPDLPPQKNNYAREVVSLWD